MHIRTVHIHVSMYQPCSIILWNLKPSSVFQGSWVPNPPPFTKLQKVFNLNSQQRVKTSQSVKDQKRDLCMKKQMYHLESRWRNSLVLLYHRPFTKSPLGSCDHLLSLQCNYTCKLVCLICISYKK